MSLTGQVAVLLAARPRSVSRPPRSRAAENSRSCSSRSRRVAACCRAQAAVKDHETKLIASARASAQQLESLFESDAR